MKGIELSDTASFFLGLSAFIDHLGSGGAAVASSLHF